jgi:hypothetical protein
MRFLAITLAFAAVACTDPEARYDAFIARTQDMRGIDAGMIESGDRFDWSGHYVLALSTTLAADLPLVFAVDAEVASDLTRVSLHVQPLTVADDDEPRTPVGEVIDVEDIEYLEDGSFGADLGEVVVPGRANPISGAEITARVMLVATAQAPDGGASATFCGQVSGMVIAPLRFDLAGSTFGAVLSEDDVAADPPLRCP